jgi:hypothetical protein
MATAWEQLILKSSIPSGTAWEHLISAGGNGGPLWLVDGLEVEMDNTCIEAEVDLELLTVEVDSDGIDVEVDLDEIEVEICQTN